MATPVHSGSMARGKGEGSIYQDSRGLWRASVELPPSADGTRRRKVISSKKKSKVISDLRKIQNDVAIYGDIATRTISIDAWVNKWLDDIAPKKINPNTIGSYRSALQNHVVKRWGKKKLSYLTPGRIRDLTAEIADNKSPSTARNLHSYLSSCLKDAVNDGYLPKHPMEHLKPPPRAKAKEPALELDDAVKLLKWLARQIDQGTEHAHLAPLWIAYLLTGARRGELLGLRPEFIQESLDVEWQLQRLSPATLKKVAADFEYEHTGVKNFYLTRPKYESTRSYPLVEPLKSMMNALAKATPDGELVFLRPDGEPWDPDGITERWAGMLHAAGVEKHDGPADKQTPPEKRVTLHGARHTVVDLLNILEVPEDIIMQIVGHTQRRTTRGYRTKQSPAVKSAMASVSHLLQTGEKPALGE